MSNTQARLFNLNDAIERDRMAQPPMELPAQQDVEPPVRQLPGHSPVRPWEAWVTIGIGVTVMMIAAFM